jgi:light-harvesting protein B-800-850 alpha chain
MADVDGQAKIWLYVRPSLGIPHFLGAIVLTAVVVHAGILGHTTWYKKFLNGEKIKTSHSLVLPGSHA